MRARAGPVIVLLVGNALISGLLLNRFMRKEVDELELTERIAFLTVQEAGIDTIEPTILAFFDEICPSCSSGAAWDSLQMLARRTNYKPVLILTSEYSTIDVENLIRLWRIEFRVVQGSALLGQTAREIQWSEFFIFIEEGGRVAPISTSISSLERRLGL